MAFIIVQIAIIWLMSITVCCQAEPELYWSNKTIPILGKVGRASRSGLQAGTLDSNYSVPALGTTVFKTGGAIGPGTLEGRGLDVLDTRQTCPPTHPVPCAGGLCCQAAFPVCCIAQNGGCCPSNKPVCVTNGCCPSGTTLCPNDPNTCKTATQTCCGLGTVCPITHTCCGLGACCPIGDTEAGKCCQATNPLESMCAGQYDVCCDGWTCPEGSTCSTDRGYCNVPVLTFGYQGPNSITIDLIRNTCLGFRSEMARGRPNVAANYQLLTYYGPNSPNRQQTDCRSSRQCCTGQLVPPGKPGAGDPTECDEYPPNSAIEGGAGAHVACVNKYANQAGGELIGAMVSGRHRGFKYWLEVVGLDCNTVQSSDVEHCNP